MIVIIYSFIQPPVISSTISPSAVYLRRGRQIQSPTLIWEIPGDLGAVPEKGGSLTGIQNDERNFVVLTSVGIPGEVQASPGG